MSARLPREGDVLERLFVDAIDDEGRGRASVGDVDVAVRGALPGDVVSARVERVWYARRLVQARRLSVVDDEAPHAPRTCVHRGPCPACPLHGVDDGFVLAFKRARVAQGFVDAGFVGDSSVEVAPTVAGCGVRQKVKLVAGGAPGRLILGHYVPHTHVVVDATGCGHAPDELGTVVLALRARLDAHRLGPDVVIAVIARRFAEGAAVVVVAHGPPPVALSALCPPEALGLAWRVPARGQSDNAIVGGDVVAVCGVVTGTPLEARAGDPRVDVDTFCQADPVSARALVQAAVAYVGEGLVVGDVVADLYAGTGAFARALVDAGHRVVAVESFSPSAAALAHLPGVEGIAARVEDALPRLQACAPRAAIVDPPRKGLGEVTARAITQLPLRRLALVSCDVDAGARDARVVVDAGFVVDAVVPVDLFPGSAEVEVLTLLRRR